MTPSTEPYSDGLSAWMNNVSVESVAAFGSRLPGATTATIITFETTSGAEVVAKIYDRKIEGVGADDVERDANAMRAAAESGLRVPRLIDADPHGDRLGWPALLMTRLEGEPRAFGADDPEPWVDGLADMLVEIAQAPVPLSPLPMYQSWRPAIIPTPTWSTKPTLWAAIANALEDPMPASPDRLIHRDFHQLNVLWSGAEPSGSVDWVNGCLGPIESDIASSRINIALADRRYDGVALADRFLHRCLAAGLPWNPLWDLDFIAGVVDRPEMFLIARDFGADLTFATVCEALETMAEKALSV